VGLHLIHKRKKSNEARAGSGEIISSMFVGKGNDLIIPLLFKGSRGVLPLPGISANTVNGNIVKTWVVLFNEPSDLFCVLEDFRLIQPEEVHDCHRGYHLEGG